MERVISSDHDPGGEARRAREPVFNAPGLVVAILAVLAVISIIGIFILLPAIAIIASVWWVVELILIITAAMRANEGIAYRYPITIRFLQ